MRVNVYHSTRTDRLPTASKKDLSSQCELIECFPGPENGDEYLIAHGYLERDGRYWGGGGASPTFLIIRVER